MSYRVKPDLYPDPTPEERRQNRYLLWLTPIFILVPNIGRFGRDLGFHLSNPIVIGATLIMGVGCFAGAIISYRSARKMVESDLADISAPRR